MLLFPSVSKRTLLTILKFSGSKFIILVLYVNDILLTSNDVDFLHETTQMLTTHFDMKDYGNVFFFWALRFIVTVLVYLKGVTSKGF